MVLSRKTGRRLASMQKQDYRVWLKFRLRAPKQNPLSQPLIRLCSHTKSPFRNEWKPCVPSYCVARTWDNCRTTGAWMKFWAGENLQKNGFPYLNNQVQYTQQLIRIVDDDWCKVGCECERRAQQNAWERTVSHFWAGLFLRTKIAALQSHSPTALSNFSRPQTTPATQIRLSKAQPSVDDSWAESSVI